MGSNLNQKKILKLHDLSQFLSITYTGSLGSCPMLCLIKSLQFIILQDFYIKYIYQLQSVPSCPIHIISIESKNNGNQTTVTSIAGHSFPSKAGKITVNSGKAMSTDCSSDA